MPVIDQILDDFEQRFESTAHWLANAPGRVNLIGEHTDYNGGFVLPAAIDRRVWLAAARRDDALIEVYSVQFDQTCVIDPREALAAQPEAPWANYVVAVVDQFLRRGEQIPGLDIAVSGDVPLGAGLSSSAAIEVGTAWLLNHVTGAGLSRHEAALLAQAAEHSAFVGVKCGIMDQLASALGEEDSALLIDCHSLDYEAIPFDGERAVILIINSMKKRGLVDSEYNRRRHECETGLQLMRRLSGQDFPTIRHIPLDVFRRHESSLPQEPRRRLRHNLTENDRVLNFVKHLREGDMAEAGRLLGSSHASLRDDYEVSIPQLDMIVDIASKTPGVFGCRLTGAGFGGCCVALADPAHADSAIEAISGAYQKQCGIVPEIYISAPAAGVDIQMVD